MSSTGSRVVRFARGLERIVIVRTAHVGQQREALSRLEQRIAEQTAREAALMDSLHSLYAGPLRLNRTTLFDLRRRGAALRQACAELRAEIALLHEDAARLRAVIEAEADAVIALRWRHERCLRWAKADGRATRLKREQESQNEQEEWGWRTGLS
jgi:hypothetical protein